MDANVQDMRAKEAEDIAMNERAQQMQKIKDRKRKSEEKEEIIRQNTAKRIESLKNDKIKERKEGQIKEELRERIHPQILAQAHPVKNSPIALIKYFYPKTRI